jgi:hypothetical protein
MLATPEYIVDSKGKKTKVVLSLEAYEELLEDLHDLKVVLERREEKRSNFADLEKKLKKDGRL